MKCVIASPFAARTLAILGRHLSGRGCPPVVRVAELPANQPGLRLDVDPALEAEAFRIRMIRDGCLEVSGGSALGLIFGMGKMLRDGSFAGGRFAFGPWRGLAAPRCPLRCVYFATHFHNYYHRAPVADIVRYVEDLALWGYNTIGAWPDKHHFEGIDDPEFQAFLARLAEIFAGAKAIGMKVNLLTLANDGYRTTPKELIGTDTRRAWYGCEICPSTPAGMALVLSNHRETLECLAGIGLDYYTLWSYDQGGCGCAACAPWGAKGMLECGKEVASLVKARQPSCRIVYSTWLFDYCGEPEWAGLDAALARGQGEWIDILLAESHGQYPRYPLEHGSPGGRPLVSFPEISMRLIHPWGGSGSNPMHRINAGIWGQCAALCDGGVLYSEGIFEDINKALYAGFYWNRNNAVEETLREYARFELGCPEASYHDLRRALDTLEDNSAFALIRDLSDSQPGYDLSGKGYRRVRYGAGVAWSRSAFAANAREACAAVLAVDGALPPWARNAWRWRLLKLRATIDAERQDHPDVVTERCADCFEELKELYHAVEGLSLSSVCPPTRKAVLGRLPGVR